MFIARMAALLLLAASTTILLAGRIGEHTAELITGAFP